MKIITIHGIRRSYKWYETFASLDEWKKHSAEILNFEYGYFTLGSFLSPWGRKRAVREFLNFYKENINDNERPSIVAHSFGTYIILKALTMHSSIVVDKIVLSGSILSTKTPWESLFQRNQINQILNDIGERDIPVLFAGIIVPLVCGPSGRNGFKINEHLKDRINEERNKFEHSDPFFTKHMKSVWLPFLLKDVKKFDYNEEILSKGIIDRMYNTSIADGLKITEANFVCRVDEASNYFGNYSIAFENTNEANLESLEIAMSADSVESASKIGFKAFGEDNRELDIRPTSDEKQYKRFRIILGEPIKTNGQSKINYSFKWAQTMSLQGDIDHWPISNVVLVKVHLIFKNKLFTYRFYGLKDKKVVRELEVEYKEELDASNSYKLNINNTTDKFDALVFYYRGSTEPSKPKIRALSKEINGHRYMLTNCSVEHIKPIYDIEITVEKGIPASIETITERARLFNEGFYVVTTSERKVIGYAQSIIWDNIDFNSFDDIKDFARHYSITGKQLYIIFITVTEEHRNRGIASWMIEELEKVSMKYGLESITLVAKSNLEIWYKKRGFNSIKHLPDFLPDKNYGAILMRKDLR